MKKFQKKVVDNLSQIDLGSHPLNSLPSSQFHYQTPCYAVFQVVRFLFRTYGHLGDSVLLYLRCAQSRYHHWRISGVVHLLRTAGKVLENWVTVYLHILTNLNFRSLNVRISNCHFYVITKYPFSLV